MILIFTVFRRADIFARFKFLVKIINIFISDTCRNFINLHICLIKQLGCFFNAYLILLGIETNTHFLGKQFSEVGTVVTKQWGQSL